MTRMMRRCGALKTFIAQVEIPTAFAPVAQPQNNRVASVTQVVAAAPQPVPHRAPTRVQLFRAYVLIRQNAPIHQDMAARRRFRVDQAAVFVNELTQRLLNRIVRIGLVRPFQNLRPARGQIATLSPYACRGWPNVVSDFF